MRRSRTWWWSGAIVLAVVTLLGALSARAPAATTILPPGATCFQMAAGPVSSGSVYMLVPSTTTPKNTWQDAGQTILNTNPIQLDANGCAIIYGTGAYRQQVYTGPVVSGLPTGFLLYDVTTTDTSSFQNVFWAGLAGGTPNALTVTDAGFNNTDGSVINFLALQANTGSSTLIVSGATPIPIKVPSGSGPMSLSSGCFGPNNPVSVVYSSSQNAFLLLTACAASATTVSAVGAPQGYLTLSSDTSNPIITADVTGSTNVYYTAFTGGQVPIWNGTAYVLFSFSQLQLALAGSLTGNTIYDVCVFSNTGTATLVTTPAWSNSAAGTSSRGTGAGTPQLQRLNGLWVNAVQITGLNGVNSYTIPANQCTYLGSILTDQTAGQVSNYLSWGQNRKWGLWNAYNRQILQVQEGDATATWSLTSTGWRASNATPGNGMTTLTGLPEEPVRCVFDQSVDRQFNNNSNSWNTGIAVNAGAITPTGKWGFFETGNAGTTTDGGSDMVAINYATSPLGMTTFTSVEIAASGGAPATMHGSPNGMVMQCNYRG